mgnify:FL=1
METQFSELLLAFVSLTPFWSMAMLVVIDLWVESQNG